MHLANETFGPGAFSIPITDLTMDQIDALMFLIHEAQKELKSNKMREMHGKDMARRALR